MLGEVTKKDFKAIADILCRYGAPGGLARDMAHYFQSQNPRFDTLRFMRAVHTCTGSRRAA